MNALVDPRIAIKTTVARVMAPPPPADLNLWAEANIKFGRESPVPGSYRRDTIPLTQRILTVLGHEHPARVVTLMASAKIFKISTPLFAKTCRITRAFRAGTQERWHVPCPHCEHFQPLEWPNFLANLDREHPEKAGFSCVSCGTAIEHKHKRGIVARGK